MFTHPRLPHNRRCCSCAFVTRLDSRYASARAMNKHLLLFVHTFDTKVSCLLLAGNGGVVCVYDACISRGLSCKCRDTLECVCDVIMSAGKNTSSEQVPSNVLYEKRVFEVFILRRNQSMLM